MNLIDYLGIYRAMTPGFLKSEILGFQTLEHMLRVSRTWDSTASLLPKGGETIWGDLDWSPEDVQNCDLETVDTHSFRNENDSNDSEINKGLQEKEAVHYGRMISFGKEAATRPSSELSTLYSEVINELCCLLSVHWNNFFVGENDETYQCRMY